MVKQKKTTPYTIDEKHTEIITEFDNIEQHKIPELQELKQTLKKSLNETTNIDKIMDIKDEIKELKKEIKRLKNMRKKYLLTNSKYIFQYFDDMKKISNNENVKNTDKVNKFFKINTTETVEETPVSKSFYQKYWRNVGGKDIDIKELYISSTLCKVCNIGELIPQDEEGIVVCNNNKCGCFTNFMIENSKPNNKDPPNEVSYTAYVRLNHFKEILSQFQAKPTTQIPEHVIDKIRERIRKERIADPSKIDYYQMREILRKLELNPYFEHIQYINSKFGIKPPVMSPELYETLCVLFVEIQAPWSIHCPKDRVNFFNYTYTLYQLCVLLGQTQFLPYIHLLKDRTKQVEQDMIWKKVCNDLDWVFIATI
jgi:hypothetical protein